MQVALQIATSFAVAAVVLVLALASLAAVVVLLFWIAMRAMAIPQDDRDDHYPVRDTAP